MGSLDKAFRCLHLLAVNGGRITVQGVCEDLDIPQSTTYRLLAELTKYGFLQPGGNGSYVAGPQLYHLAGVALSSLEMRSIALPLMQELSAKITHSVYLMIRSGFDAVCVEKVDSSDGLQLNVRIGSRRKLHSSGIAKIFLPYVSESELNDYLKQPLDRFTPSTVTTREALLPQIESIRQNGYAISTQEFAPGARSIGVPIRDFRGSVIAGLGVGGSIQALSDATLPGVLAQMQETAGEISRQLGFTPPIPARGKKYGGAAR